MNEVLQTWRCEHCGRILAKITLTPPSVVQIKCGCNAMNVLRIMEGALVRTA